MYKIIIYIQYEETENINNYTSESNPIIKELVEILIEKGMQNVLYDLYRVNNITYHNFLKLILLLNLNSKR